MHFESTDASYLRDVKESLRRAHARVVNMAPSTTPTTGTAACRSRRQAVALGGRRAQEVDRRRRGAGIAGDPAESRRHREDHGHGRPIAAYKELGEYGKSRRQC